MPVQALSRPPLGLNGDPRGSSPGKPGRGAATLPISSHVGEVASLSHDLFPAPCEPGFFNPIPYCRFDGQVQEPKENNRCDDAHSDLEECDPGQGCVEVVHAGHATGQGAVTPFESRSGMDRFADRRFVLAKGAGPGIYNRWVAHCGGFRMHCGRIDYAYRPDGTRCA